ncbi:unnamed protein product [Somion occarium]|uniref:Uncharacterized protein n=1 Tax=Somion occarium TaxID=3059160 RepID=A0ABP1DNI9_9APHY
MSFEKVPRDAATRVIIVGAGIGGISTAIALRRQLKHDNFTIYELGNEVGGTWRANTYPGCASDVHTHWYSLSTDLNPNWPQSHVFQPDLKQYWQDLAHKYRLYDHIVFNSKVVSAEWVPKTQVYRVEVESVDGKRLVEYGRILVAGTGILNTPNYPTELSGVKKFKGDWFHSANWNHSVDLRSKRVAVIGNGCSAAQFLPIIAEEPTTQIVQFWRTPMWFLPKWRDTYSPLMQWVFTNIPLTLRWYRNFLMFRQEMLYMTVIRGGPNTWLRNRFMKGLTKYLKENAPEKYHDVLTPNYPFGCKRLILDTGYYESLHRPNVELNNDGIVEVNETGILTKKGETIPLDVIILGTGFLANDLPFHVRGSDGRSVHEYYKQQGGPTAYYGTMTPGFPNFFILSGPNTATGHGSVIFTEEVQINYMIKVIKPILSDLATAFEPTDAASDSYNAWVQSKLGKSVWNACTSWYRAEEGKGKITGIFPGTFVKFWWTLREPVWGDFKVSDGTRWKRRRAIGKVVKTVLGAGALGAGVYAIRNPEVVDHILGNLSKQVLRSC